MYKVSLTFVKAYIKVLSLSHTHTVDLKGSDCFERNRKICHRTNTSASTTNQLFNSEIFQG